MANVKKFYTGSESSANEITFSTTASAVSTDRTEGDNVEEVFTNIYNNINNLQADISQVSKTGVYYKLKLKIYNNLEVTFYRIGNCVYGRIGGTSSTGTTNPTWSSLTNNKSIVSSSGVVDNVFPCPLGRGSASWTGGWYYTGNSQFPPKGFYPIEAARIICTYLPQTNYSFIDSGDHIFKPGYWIISPSDGQTALLQSVSNGRGSYSQWCIRQKAPYGDANTLERYADFCYLTKDAVPTESQITSLYETDSSNWTYSGTDDLYNCSTGAIEGSLPLLEEFSVNEISN